ncbi:ATP-binding cassette domain-containing protein [Flavobacteriaceae bacterium TP-CH-4]|uniref:ATP-binding cassette domain-containing protein n=1 Tax=Pelagihabitans pacificus TaxID=2696054 RepID=A0A967API2_9FLAO|nr:ATP-binding cassette domain-containing protein [Pelagihabitans pacificus]NHF57974.1 ATP-binding cassette domain-containing protein [Pelagihabitans pacificus]
MSKAHWAILIDNNSQKQFLIDSLLQGNVPTTFESLKPQKGALFSKLALEAFIDEEERHGRKIINSKTAQLLKTMSSGEQKKALLAHILKQHPDFIILDNPFDNLDSDAQKALRKKLQAIADTTSLIQIASRKNDLLPFIHTIAQLEGKLLVPVNEKEVGSNRVMPKTFQGTIPTPLQPIEFEGEALIELKNVSVSYSGKPILNNINWTINKGSFWELRGKNGSGKTTILSMITGENPKGYGQELYIFGRKKGSGESVWDIKKRIGYFTPSMTDKFTGYHTVEHMVISGLHDSIGLYVTPTEAQIRLAKEWLQLIEMWHLKDTLYHDLSMGQKRLVMCIRAMIKHPVLLILDEPTAGLDDTSAHLFVQLVNKFAKESASAIIFVSHRKERGLLPDRVYRLEKTNMGSVGKMV